MKKYRNGLIWIWENSLDIQEKLKLRNLLESDGFDNSLLDEWKSVLGTTNLKFFTTRLKWSGYDAQTVNFLCSKVKFKEIPKMLPDWVNFLGNLLDFIKKSPKRLELTNKDIPFFDILEIFANLCIEKVSLENKLFDPQVRLQLKKYLIVNLCYISQQSFLNEMYLADKTYKEYCEWVLLDVNIFSFFSKYPALAKLIGITCLNWIENTNELSSRIETDIESIRKVFAVQPNAKISEIKTGLSDFHNDNRTVCEITFLDKSKIIYKPRNIDIEYAYFGKLVDWFNKKSGLENQLQLKILPKKDYGWVEYVEYKPCSSIEETKDYYYRFGSLLAILHTLSATDYHNENLIASGSYPVIVDCETLLSPHIKTATRPLNKLTPLIDKAYGDSVSRIGILPQWLTGPNGEIYDNSSLGTEVDYYLPHQQRKWDKINEDDMSFVYKTTKPKLTKNIVYVKEKRIDPLDYTNNFEKGFSDTYKFLMSNKKTLKDLLSKNFSEIKLRFVFRPTKIYALIQDTLYHPDYMISGAKRNINFDYLSIGLTGNLNIKFKYWDILDYEQKQLQVQDIPYFETISSSKNIRCENNILFKNCFLQSPINQTLNKIEGLSASDLKWQLNIIKNSLATVKIEKRPASFSDLSSFKNLSGIRKPTKDFLINESRKIGDTLIKTAIISPDERCTWVSYVSNIMSHSYGFKPIGYDLANGNMGVALFLISLFKATKEPKYKKMGYMALKPVIDVLNTEWSKQEYIDQFGVGGTSGVGSIIYGLATLYELTQDSALLKYAENFRDLVTKARITNSIRQDFVSGTAGCLLSSSKLNSLKPDKKNVTLIRICVQDIVNKRIGMIDGTCAWEYQVDKYLTGFSHGSSGIIYSLSKAANLLQDGTINNIINEALSFEEKNYSPKYNNWADYRFEEVLWDTVSWCHGATGIGFSRLGMLRNINNSQIRKDLERAIEKTKEVDMSYIDTICCGNFGRIDLLLTAGIESKNSALIDLTYKMSKAVVDTRVTSGFNLFSNFKTYDINVGFYQGIAGIGYELLRLANPKMFKSVLMLD